MMRAKGACLMTNATWLSTRCSASLGAIFTLACALSACSDDTTNDAGLADAGRDASVSPDAGAPDATVPDSGVVTPACEDPAVLPLPGGGVGGGRIRGALTVFVRAAESGDAIAGARVLAQFDGAPLWGTTDARGCVELRDPSAFGAGRLHVFAEGRVYLSLVGFDAALTTVNLAPINGTPALEPAKLSGIVTGFDVLTASTATVARVGFVQPISSSVFTLQPEQGVRAENENVGTDVVVSGRNGRLDFRDYSLDVVPWETVGLAIRAGTLSFPAFGAPTLELTHDGFALGLDVDPGERLTDVELEISHPLTETMTLTFGRTPSLPSLYAWSYVVLPDASGWYYAGQASGSNASGRVTFEDLPRLDGVLAGSTYGAAVQAASDTAFSLLVEPGSASPTLDLGDLPAVPKEITSEGRALSASTEAEPSDLVFLALDRQGGRVWTVVFVSSVREPSITLPVPPEGFSDPLSGRLALSALVVRYEGVSLDAFSFSELTDARIRSFSGDTVDVEF
jgi:hypothetical protein